MKIANTKQKINNLFIMVFLAFSAISIAQTTSIPDSNFENYLETHTAYGAVVSIGDTNSMGNGIANDHLVFTNRINNVTSLEATNLNIADLTGIQSFTALTNLNVSSNQLTTLDLSGLTLITNLDASGNNITSINISSLTNLTNLLLNANNISFIDLTNNTLLENVYLSFNSLTQLDVSHNTQLKKLYCINNQLSALNTNQNTQLVELICSGNNNITSLNITQNTNLTFLECSELGVTSIDLSNNINLEHFYGNTAVFTSLDFSHNPNLLNIDCSNNNSLVSLNVKNGHNQLITNSNFYIASCSNLICVEVDNPTWSTANWTNIDNQTNFSLNCGSSTTSVPDDNFETYLETHDINGNTVSMGDTTAIGNGTMDDLVQTSRMSAITNLVVSSLNIADLTGIRDCIALTNLDCSGNNLSSLNLLGLTALENLNCAANSNLTQIDISANTALQDLQANSCNLSNLDVSHNTQLTSLRCAYNNLSQLDISANTALQELYANQNHLQQIDCTHNLQLIDIQVADNQLTNVNLNLNTALTAVSISDNQLTELHIQNGHNTAIANNQFYANNNPNLICIYVDNASWSTTNWQNIDNTSHFVENQAACNALAVSENSLTNFTVYPNPATDFVTIQSASNIKINSIYIYNMLGKLLIKKEVNNLNYRLDLQELPIGNYYLKIKTNNGNTNHIINKTK